jgi:hypothetical protein
VFCSRFNSYSIKFLQTKERRKILNIIFKISDFKFLKKMKKKVKAKANTNTITHTSKSSTIKKIFQPSEEVSQPYDTNFNQRKYSKQYLECRQKHKEALLSKANSDFELEQNIYLMRGLSLEKSPSSRKKAPRRKKITINSEPTYIIYKDEKRPLARSHLNKKTDKIKESGLVLKPILKKI